MLYLHDVWVNWFEGEENGYNVCAYHEWRRDDRIEIMDQLPVLYLSSPLYSYIENDLCELPKKLLQTIHKRAIKRKGQVKTTFEYAAIITDGEGILVFDTAGYEIPIRKSRLIPRQEQQVYLRIQRMHPQTFHFEPGDYEKDVHRHSLDQSDMIGLTRKERKWKQIIMMGLDQLQTSSTVDELRYWLTEWNPKKYPRIKEMNASEVWTAIYDGVRSGWSQSHEEFGEKLIKNNSFLQHMWEVERTDGHRKTPLK